MSDFASFRAKWPSGAAILAYVMFDLMIEADKKGTPFETWTERHFEKVRESIVELMKGMRRHATPAAVLTEWESQPTLVPVNKQALADMRRYIGRLEDEALELFGKLRRTLTRKETKVSAQHFVREWLTFCQSRPMHNEERGKSLDAYLNMRFVDTPSDGVTRGLLEAIERSNFPTTSPDGWPAATGVANAVVGGERTVEQWQYELVPPAIGKARYEDLNLEPIENEDKFRQAMDEYSKRLDDRDSDLMFYAMAKYAREAKDPTAVVEIHINDLMEALGFKKHRGSKGESFRTEDKAAVRQRFEQLEQGWITIRKAIRDERTGKVEDFSSRLLQVDSVTGQADLDGRIRDWSKVYIVFGRAWSHRLFNGAGRQLALMQGHCLSYHHEKERIEKRILKRLGWHWRLNRDQDQTPPRSVLKWIRDDVGDDPYTYRRQDAERFEAALDRLKRDQQIDGWSYVDGGLSITEAGESRGRLAHRWLESWLEREISIDAPAALITARTQERLETRRRKAAKQPAQIAAPVPEAPAEDFGKKLRAFLQARQISGVKAAAMTGINNTTLSRIMSGDRAPTEQQRKALESWMQELRNRPDLAAETAGK